MTIHWVFRSIPSFTWECRLRSCSLVEARASFEKQAPGFALVRAPFPAAFWSCGGRVSSLNLSCLPGRRTLQTAIARFQPSAVPLPEPRVSPPGCSCKKPTCRSRQRLRESQVSQIKSGFRVTQPRILDLSYPSARSLWRDRAVHWLAGFATDNTPRHITAMCSRALSSSGRYELTNDGLSSRRCPADALVNGRLIATSIPRVIRRAGGWRVVKHEPAQRDLLLVSARSSLTGWSGDSAQTSIGADQSRA